LKKSKKVTLDIFHQITAKEVARVLQSVKVNCQVTFQKLSMGGLPWEKIDYPKD